MAIIDLTILDNDILNKIPMSIRLSTNEIELEELPLPVQYILREYIKSPTKDIYVPSDIYDVKPEISPYNDFKNFTTMKEAIIEYLENYVGVKKGSYPFDPQFGNNLHKHLQTKDTSLRETLVGNELQNIIRLVNESFNGNILIVSSRMTKNDIGGGFEYNLHLSIAIEDETIKLEIK
ncbi:MAG: hypothetical protein H8D97_00750 [Proteobacteria bacterium]|nr:hypothetical protein [Pseudomonadota bacterium]